MNAFNGMVTVPTTSDAESRSSTCTSAASSGYRELVCFWRTPPLPKLAQPNRSSNQDQKRRTESRLDTRTTQNANVTNHVLRYIKAGKSQSRITTLESPVIPSTVAALSLFLSLQTLPARNVIPTAELRLFAAHSGGIGATLFRNANRWIHPAQHTHNPQLAPPTSRESPRVTGHFSTRSRSGS
jgi:hypothetical protein